ncbi:MAG: class I SAM-dependent methyltransferase [bacterium]
MKAMTGGVVCLVCAGERLKAVDERDGYTLLRCRSCGFGFAWPRPRAEELEVIYDEAFDEKSEGGIWSGELTRENPKGKRSGMDTFRTEEREYRRRFDLIRRFVPAERGALLDVGCAAGFFVDYVRRQGWRADGLDVSGYNARLAREYFDLDIIQKPFTKSGIPEESYDAVIMRFILEHSLDPFGDAAEAHRVLKPGGILFVHIPNEFNFLQTVATRLVVKERWWFAVPHHLNFFTPRSLEKLLARAGLRLRHLTTTFPVELFLLLGVNYVKNPERGKVVGKTVSFIDRLSEDYPFVESAVEKFYRRLLNRYGVGRTILAVAKKTR